MSDYNPRYGGVSGRVDEDDFSIDGKSWNYRDPSNYNSMSRDRSKATGGTGDDDYNRHASSEFNQLYDYSYGQARDAAKALGIGNVSNKEEADRIIDYIQNPPQAESEQEDKEDKIEDKPKAEVPATPVAPSQEITEARERVNAFNAEMRGDRFNVYGLKKSPFSERSSEIYNPNEGFQANQQTTVSPDGNQQAQTFMQSKLNDTKNKYNFQPTLK